MCFDTPLKNGLQNGASRIKEIDIHEYEKDKEAYLTRIKTSYCNCCNYDEKFYGRGITCVATPDVSVLEQPELEKVFKQGMKYRQKFLQIRTSQTKSMRQ